MLFQERAIIELETVDSTNNYAAKLLRESIVPDGTVITAQSQTDGRGQRGANWDSNFGENLLLSIILYPKQLISQNQFYLSKAISLAIREFIEMETNQDAFIKWPNDIIVNNKKIAGILIETNWQDVRIQSVIAGVGINLNQKSFDHPKATSCAIQSKNYHSEKDSLIKVLDLIEKKYIRLLSGSWGELDYEYKNHLYRIGEETNFKYRGELIRATIKGVNEGGLLLINTSDGLDIKCDLKEIELIYP